MERIKHVLGIWFRAAKGAEFLAGVCAGLAKRGGTDVLIVCHHWLAAGAEVTDGQSITTIDAMKMEAAITAPKSGTIERVAATAQVEDGDLFMVVN